MGIYDGLLRVYRNLRLVHMNLRLVHMNLRLVHMNALCFPSNICTNRHDLDISIFKVRMTCLEKRLVTRALSKVPVPFFTFSNPAFLHVFLIVCHCCKQCFSF